MSFVVALIRCLVIRIPLIRAFLAIIIGHIYYYFDFHSISSALSFAAHRQSLILRAILQVPLYLTPQKLSQEQIQHGLEQTYSTACFAVLSAFIFRICLFISASVKSSLLLFRRDSLSPRQTKQRQRRSRHSLSYRQNRRS